VFAKTRDRARERRRRKRIILKIGWEGKWKFLELRVRWMWSI